jgi:hypothetical protein
MVGPAEMSAMPGGAAAFKTSPAKVPVPWPIDIAAENSYVGAIIAGTIVTGSVVITGAHDADTARQC